MNVVIIGCVCLTILAPCLAQGPMVLDPRFNQPNMNPPNIQQPPNNVQQIPVANQNPQPMPAANQPQAIPVIPNQNSNPQAIPVMPNPNRQPIPIANQQPGQNVPGVGPGSQTPQPQLTPEEQSQITCAQAGRLAVSQCFNQNGGFQMVTVIALLSNGTQGQLPPNAEQVKQTLCQSQSQIVACVFDNIAKYNGSQECSTPSSFIRLEQETVGLLNGVQQMCGKGLMPKVTPCMQRLNYDMMQCYKEVGLNPELFSPRGSRMEGAIIGDNREVARMFCGKRKQLHACQNRVLDNCEGAKVLQALSGNDQASIQAGNDVLCKDINVYVSGLVCFQSPSPEVESCANSMIREMTEVTMRQIRDNLNTDDFFTEYCRVRFDNLKCDGAAWNKVCQPVAVGLKREYQCNLLPGKCKSIPAIRELYNDACAEASFARGLRNTENNTGSDDTSGSATTVAGLSTMLGTVVMFLLFI